MPHALYDPFTTTPAPTEGDTAPYRPHNPQGGVPWDHRQAPLVGIRRCVCPPGVGV